MCHGKWYIMGLDKMASLMELNPKMLGLMDLLHSPPPTSVQNETSFNQMKLIKTDRRHRLSQEHLNDLMMIRLQSPSIMEFDPTTAINTWMVS